MPMESEANNAISKVNVITDLIAREDQENIPNESQGVEKNYGQGCVYSMDCLPSSLSAIETPKSIKPRRKRKARSTPEVGQKLFKLSSFFDKEVNVEEHSSTLSENLEGSSQNNGNISNLINDSEDSEELPPVRCRYTDFQKRHQVVKVGRLSVDDLQRKYLNSVDTLHKRKRRKKKQRRRKGRKGR